MNKRCFMEVDTKDRCACKGCRTCLKCESNGGKEVLDYSKHEVFIYCHKLQCGIKATENQSTNSITIHTVDFPGVIVLQNLVSDEVEKSLASHIDSNPWKESQSGRRKQDYGPKVNFKKQKINSKCFTGLPHYIKPVVKKFKDIQQVSDFQTVEQCNLEYEPSRGSSIDPHFDDDWLWGDRLVTLNLLSDSWLTMTRQSSDTIEVRQLENVDLLAVEEDILTEMKKELPANHRSIKHGLSYADVVVKVPLKRKSLVILDGEARYKWKHSIQRHDIQARRLCCTFRELSAPFLNDEKGVGKNLLEIASSFQGQVVL